MRRIFAIGLLPLLTLSPVAKASSAASDSISGVSSATEGLGSFAHTGTRTALPACATSTAWSINLSSAGGAATMSVLISAYVANRPISVAGTGTCNGYGQEYVSYISF